MVELVQFQLDFKVLCISEESASFHGSCSTLASEACSSTLVEAVKYSDNFTSVPYGFQAKAAYEHHKKNTDLIGGYTYYKLIYIH